MFGRFFGEKVTVKKNAEVGDIVINLPDFSGPDVPPILWPLRGTKRVIFAVPLDITCMELKQRIHGKTKIPLNSMALFYMGTILNSDEVLDREIYEQELTEDSDDDIFRARLYLGILDEPEDEIELEDFSSDSESSNEESTIGEMEYANNDKDEKEEVDVVENVEEEEEGEIAERTFDMKLNLERIGCGRFYPDLVAEGFVDEGSFSNLTDDILKRAPLFVPLVSRQRITALADILRRRVEGVKIVVAATESVKVVDEMITQGKIVTKSVEGLEGTFTTKMDLKRAWEKKVKGELVAERNALIASQRAAEQAAEQATLEKLNKDFKDMFVPAEVAGKPRKELPVSVQNLISAAKSRLARDEFECLVDPATITTSSFCCLGHHDECMKMRSTLEEMSHMLLQADLQVAADRVDYHHTTFVCRYQLKLILLQFLEKFRVPVVSERVEELLDMCVMNNDDQLRLREWAAPEKRANPLFDMPLSGYSTHRFASLVSNEISEYQQKKILVLDE